jgi:hypothetical protein
LEGGHGVGLIYICTCHQAIIISYFCGSPTT